VRDTNPDESLEAEGLPNTDEFTPGTDVETSPEALMVPRDHPVAAGGDPAYPVTVEDERIGETVAERAGREEPDFDTSGRRVVHPGEAPAFIEGDSDLEAELADDDPVVDAEEAAMHIIEW
jgi:hypothetical protein